MPARRASPTAADGSRDACSHRRHSGRRSTRARLSVSGEGVQSSPVQLPRPRLALQPRLRRGLAACSYRIVAPLVTSPPPLIAVSRSHYSVLLLDVKRPRACQRTLRASVGPRKMWWCLAPQARPQLRPCRANRLSLMQKPSFGSKKPADLNGGKRPLPRVLEPVVGLFATQISSKHGSPSEARFNKRCCTATLSVGPPTPTHVFPRAHKYPRLVAILCCSPCQLNIS